MENKHTEHEHPEGAISFPAFITSDIMSLEFPLLPETDVANFTADIGKFFTLDSEQEKRFRALEKLIERRINDFRSEKGIGAVVSIGDIKKIRKWLNPDTLYLYDETTKIFHLDWQPVDIHAMAGELVRLFRSAETWIVPIRTWSLSVECKNIIRLPFDILKMQNSDDNRYFGEAMHELIHHAEFEMGFQKSEDAKYTAYIERNATFWDDQLREVFEIARAEEILMDDMRKTEFFNALNDLLGAFLSMKKWEAGKSVSGIEGIKKEKYQKWLPDSVQLYDLMGIKIRSRDVLEHYASRVCGERLQSAAKLIAWRLSFDDDEMKLRREAHEFTKIHHMSEQEAKEHIQMVEERLLETRKKFEKEFDAFYYPPEIKDSDNSTLTKGN